MTKQMQIVLILLLVVAFISCNYKESKQEISFPPTSFHADTLKIPDIGGRKLRGQVLYMPVYSNIPYQYKQQYDLSAFLAIHNTDLKNQIKVTKVDFLNTEGLLVKSYVSTDQRINPLATMIVVIPKTDQSGTGANFILEWMADQLVNEPLIESIMTDISGNKGLAFVSTGRIIREIK